jgi:hypothetical protein
MTSHSSAAYQREWAKANPEKVRAYRPKQKAWTTANRERVNAQSRAWYHRNKAQALASVRRYQAQKAAALCECCAPISFKFIYLQARSLKMEVDHVQPLSKDGKHCLRNLQLLERHDNRVKHARWAA